jgi:tetratricopeptide (TPR) repeat protein
VVTGLEGARSAQRRVLDVETPTVGRETELAAVQAAIDRARGRSQPEAALLWGQPGIGKSRLHDELLPGLRADTALCLEARGDPSKTRTSYGLLADALGRHAGLHVGQPLPARRRALAELARRLLPDDDDRAGEVAAFVGEVTGIPARGASPALRVARADPQVMRERVVAAFEALLEGAGRAGLVALCLEDLHWADEESLELCEQLLERLERTPLFLLGTARPELLERRPTIFEAVEAARVELRPLGRRSLRRLLRALLGPGLSPGLEQLIGRWSDGNPYFAEELVSWLVTRKLLARAPDGGWSLQADPSALELPVGIEGAIQGRLDQLQPELKELLKAASVLGEVFWAGGCLALGFLEAEQQLPELERAQFITPRASSRVAGTTEWSFRHALVQQVAYQMLPRDLRRHLHLLAARWLEGMGETDSALLALHFERGGDHDRSAEYYARAGEKALADGDLERAADCFQTSLGSGEPSERITERLGPARSASERLAPRQLSRRLLGLARTLILAGSYDRAWEALELLPEPGTARERAELLFMRGRILYGRTSYAEAEETLGRAAALLERGDGEGEGDPDLLFRVRHSLFYAVFAQGRYRRAGELGEALHAAALQDAQPDSLCTAKLALAYYNVADGDLSASLTLAAEAVEHAREIGHPYREVDALTLLGFARELVGFYDGALAAFSEAKRLADRMKTLYHQASIDAWTGRVLLAQGSVTDAVLRYQAAIRSAETLGDSRTLSMALAGQARARCRLGSTDDLSEAKLGALRALELAGNQAQTIVPEACMSLAQVLLAQGAGDEAVVHAMAGTEAMQRLDTREQCEVEVLLTAREALVVVGRKKDAAEMLRRAITSIEAQAGRISDSAAKARFVQAVPHNARALQIRATLEEAAAPE